MNLTPELLADLRKKAEAAAHVNPFEFYPGQTPQPLVDYRHRAAPSVVLALLDRIEALERKVMEWQLATRCGAPVDAGLLRHINLEVAANLCTNVEDAQRIRAHAQILKP